MIFLLAFPSVGLFVASPQPLEAACGLYLKVAFVFSFDECFAIPLQSLTQWCEISFEIINLQI
jgi:hypothetical protein